MLGRANVFYIRKGFEYFGPGDALTGYSRYPELSELDNIAKQLLCSYDPYEDARHWAARF